MTGTLAQMWGGFLFRFYIAGRFLLSHACWLTDQPKFKANRWYSIDIWSWHDETLIHSLRKTVLNSAVISKVSFSSIFSFHQLLMETSGVFLPLVHKQCVFKQPSFIESCWCFYYVYILKSILMHLIKKSFKQWVLLIRCKWWVIQWLRGHTCTLSLPPPAALGQQGFGWSWLPRCCHWAGRARTTEGCWEGSSDLAGGRKDRCAASAMRDYMKQKKMCF